MKIVAPAGNPERFIAALKGGADEIYMGLAGFGARRSADNFTIAQFLEALDYAHIRGVSVNLTLNTLMTENEMDFLYPNLKALYERGLDAVIIQDTGLFRFLRENFPDLPIHASTQMAVGNHTEINFLRKMGIARFILPRELSFEEIRGIRERTMAELEVFVSGALCICHSGKCYLSSFVGGRSGNRGLCAQPCRKRYRAEQAGEGFLLSPKDQLLGPAEIEKLAAAGVESIKIEGRMKDPHYVYETVRYYREVLHGGAPTSRTAALFNRGYDTPYFYGVSKTLINTKYSANMGVEIGAVAGGKIELKKPVSMGDGVIWLDGKHRILGGHFINSKNLRKQMPEGASYLRRTYDKTLNDAIAAELAGERKAPLSITGRVKAGENPSFTFAAPGKGGVSVSCAATVPDIPGAARSNPLGAEDLRAKFAELGATEFALAEFFCDVDPGLFLPLSLIKDIKRRGVAEIREKLLQSYRRETVNPEKKPAEPKGPRKTNENPVISVIVRTNAQLKAAVENHIQKIYRVKKSPLGMVSENNAAQIDENCKMIWNLYELIRHPGKDLTLHWMWNITNRLAVETWHEAFPKVGTVMISPELSYDKIREIGSGSLKKALLIYGRLRAMTITADLFRGRDTEMKNEQGDAFRLGRNEYRNTEIHFAKPLDVIGDDRIKTLGVDEFVLEFTDESYEETGAVLSRLDHPGGEITPYNYLRGVY
ncbi:MAG: U32 family peptidase [Fusobacteriaceae bacterium]|jgi:putative protease|nr:U32 family peptidase [Fusobacteriaceae bacterium]